MRIALLDPPSFTVPYDHRLATALAARGHDVHLLTSPFVFGEPPLQRRVIGDIVIVERLLDHHQLEFVEPREVIGVRERVRGIRVHHQRHRSEPLADRRDGVVGGYRRRGRKSGAGCGLAHSNHPHFTMAGLEPAIQLFINRHEVGWPG